MRGFVQNVPFFLPAVVLSLLIAVLVARRLARQLSTRPWVAFLLVVSTGLVVAATLTPLQEALDGSLTPRASCDLRRIGLANFGGNMRLDDSALNILLFMPLGIAIGLLPHVRRSAGVLLVAVALPFLIEATQLMFGSLGRSCQSADVVDNLTGLAIGMLVGSVASWVVSRLRV